MDRGPSPLWRGRVVSGRGMRQNVGWFVAGFARTSTAGTARSTALQPPGTARSARTSTTGDGSAHSRLNHRGPLAPLAPQPPGGPLAPLAPLNHRGRLAPLAPQPPGTAGCRSRLNHGDLGDRAEEAPATSHEPARTGGRRGRAGRPAGSGRCARDRARRWGRPRAAPTRPPTRRGDGRVVAVDHPREAVVLRDRGLGVVLQVASRWAGSSTRRSARSPSRRWPASRPYQSASSPVSRCTACSRSGTAGRPARRCARGAAAAGRSCRRHVAQVGAGVGEAHLDPGPCAIFCSILGRWLLIVVRQRISVPCSSTRSRNASTGSRGGRGCRAGRDLTEGLADHRGVGAVDDLGVEEVGATRAGRTWSRSPAEPGAVVGARGRSSPATFPSRCSAAAPEPNSLKIARSMPSAYTSNGTGRCCQRKSAPSRLTTLASSRIRWMMNGIALMSAAESRLVFSGRRPSARQPIDPSAWVTIVCGWLASGRPGARGRDRAGSAAARASRGPSP